MQVQFARRWTSPFLAGLCLLLGCPDPTQTPAAGDDDSIDDPAVHPLELAAEVSAAELTVSIGDLESFGTRHTLGDGDDEACDYLVSRLTELGYQPQRDVFTVQGEEAVNVIARKEGLERPDIVYLFSAHYDSTSEDPQVIAPGADDNASAVAAVLEAARILAPHDTPATPCGSCSRQPRSRAAWARRTWWSGSGRKEWTCAA